MDFEHTSGIYKIENTVNGKCYIGQSEDIGRRIQTHFRALRSGAHYNKHLQSAWDKYGEDAFDVQVVTECDPRDLDETEIRYIREYNAFANGYNMGVGGNSNRGWHHTEESKQKMRDSHPDVSGSNNPMFGISLRDVLSPAEFEQFRMGESLAASGANNPFYGRRHSALTKSLISKANKGRLSGEKHPSFGKPLSEQTKKKIATSRAAHYSGYSHGNMPNAKRVVCLNTREVFASLQDATEKYGACPSSISSCCSGKHRSAGFVNAERAVFVYYDDFLLLSDSAIVKMVQAAQAPTSGKNNSRSKPVICINTGTVYDNCRAAAGELNLDYSSISKVCRGVNKSCGKDSGGDPLRWMFYEDYLSSHANHESEA